MEEKPKIIVFKESLFDSFLSDIWTFFVIVASFSLNEILTGSTFLNGVLLFMLVFWVLEKGKVRSHEFYNIDDAVKHLKADE